MRVGCSCSLIRKPAQRSSPVRSSNSNGPNLQSWAAGVVKTGAVSSPWLNLFSRSGSFAPRVVYSVDQSA